MQQGQCIPLALLGLWCTTNFVQEQRGITCLKQLNFEGVSGLFPALLQAWHEHCPAERNRFGMCECVCVCVRFGQPGGSANLANLSGIEVAFDLMVHTSSPSTKRPDSCEN